VTSPGAEAEPPVPSPRQIGAPFATLLNAEPKNGKIPWETAMLNYILRRLTINIPRLIVISIISFIIIQLPTCSQDFQDWSAVIFVQDVSQKVIRLSHISRTSYASCKSNHRVFRPGLRVRIDRPRPPQASLGRHSSVV
jgi:hypothetical protein